MLNFNWQRIGRASNQAGANRAPGMGRSSRQSFLPTRAGIIELIILAALLAMLEGLWFSPSEFAKIEPHPYWVPVVLLSLQYGTADGLLAALCAILAMLAFNWPTQGIEEDYYRYVIRTTALPVSWIIAAIVIGEIRGRQRTEVLSLRQTLARTQAQSADITRHCRQLNDKIVRLERGLASVEGQSVGSVAAALDALSAPAPHAWRQAFAQAQQALLGGGTCLLVLQSGKTLVPVLRSALPYDGQPGEDRSRRPLKLSSELIENLLRGRTTFCALHEDEAEVLGDTALFAGALKATQHSRTFGMLLVETLDPACFTADAEHRFDLLRRELGRCLSERGYQDLLDTADTSIPVDAPRLSLVALTLDDGSGIESGAGEVDRAWTTVSKFGRA